MIEDSQDFRKTREQLVQKIYNIRRQIFFAKNRNQTLFEHEPMISEQQQSPSMQIPVLTTFSLPLTVQTLSTITPFIKYEQFPFIKLFKMQPNFIPTCLKILRQNNKIEEKIIVAQILQKIAEKSKHWEKIANNESIDIFIEQIKMGGKQKIRGKEKQVSKIKGKEEKKQKIEQMIEEKDTKQDKEQQLIGHMLWTIGNIALHDPVVRNKIIRKGAIEAVSKVLKLRKSKKIAFDSAWALNCLLSGSPQPDFQKIKEGIKDLCKIFQSGFLEERKQLLAEILWTISSLMEGKKQKVQLFIQLNILQAVLSYSTIKDQNFFIPILKILCILSKTPENGLKKIPMAQIYKFCKNLLETQSKRPAPQILQLQFNITKTPQNIDELFAQKSLLSTLVDLFVQSDTNAATRIAISGIMGNLSARADWNESIDFYLDYRILEVYVQILGQPMFDLWRAVEALKKILDAGAMLEDNVFAERFEKSGGVKNLEILALSLDKKISQTCQKILDRFFRQQYGIQ